MRETVVQEASPHNQVRDTGHAALEVRDLVTEFRTDRGQLRAVNDVSFRLERGRVLAVIGESGSGKSAMLRSILGIQPKTATVEPGSMRAVLSTAPTPVVTPQPISAARSSGISLVILTRAFSCTSMFCA